VLAAVGRAPLLPRELLPKVEASYGSVGKDAMREVMRVLAELKESGLIKRVPGGYVRR
jgi:predicted Rossmann fold nucleotide-binding protein DprA/Smf involved in DNA uptake